MPPKRKWAFRVTFWVVFLSVSAYVGWHDWKKYDPLRNHPTISKWWLGHNVDQLSSRNPKQAVAAWMELERCYLTKWAAYDWLVFQVKERVWRPEAPPIHFRLHYTGGRYTASTNGGPSACRNVTEAMMAILYQEEGWQRLPGNVGYRGDGIDWRKWWDTNWTAFPNRTLKGLPSGPEAPRTRR